MLCRLLRIRRVSWLLLKMVVDVIMKMMAMSKIDPFRLTD